MHRRNSWADTRGESGSASLEFLAGGTLLLVPTLYLVIALMQIQTAQLAVEGASRDGSRVVATASSDEEGRDRLNALVGLAARDYGLSRYPDDTTVRLECRPRPDDCVAREGVVVVEVRTVVTLPVVPPALGDLGVGSIAVASTSSTRVSTFAEAR